MTISLNELRRVRADVVVVGAGGAASRAALTARKAGATVRMVAKAPLKTGGSTVHGASESMNMAAAAGLGDPNDSPEQHYRDTMAAAHGFIDPMLVRTLAEDAPKRLKELIDLGVNLDRDGDRIKVAKVEMNTVGRAVSVSGKTGTAFVNAITDELLRLGVEADQNVALIDLLRHGDGSIAGVLGWDTEARQFVAYEAPSVVLGTGGIHGAFAQQVSTAEMTGDGQAICWRHGAEMVNMEFHQIGPALVHPYVQLFSAQCFRMHPRMLNSRGEEFLQNYVPEGIPIDKVYDEKGFRFSVSTVGRYIDIAIAREVNEGRGTERGGVNFSFAGASRERMQATMPHTMRWLQAQGLDPQRDLLQVGIAFQCMNGGVRMTDSDAQSSIPGLYVIGELAGGIRGPDRPGGNSLAEGQVFGTRAGAAAAKRALALRSNGARSADARPALDTLNTFLSRPAAGGLDVPRVTMRVRNLMQRYCLVEKNGKDMQAALDEVMGMRRDVDQRLAIGTDTLLPGLALRNMTQNAENVLRCALNRRETRSGHLRTDYPDTDESLRHSYVAQNKGGEFTIRRHDYPMN